MPTVKPWERIDSYFADLAYSLNPKSEGIRIRFDPQTIRHGSYRAHYKAGKVCLDLAISPIEDNFFPTFQRALNSALQIYFHTTTAIAVTGRKDN